MSRDPRISAGMRRAADEHLATGSESWRISSDRRISSDKSMYSCDALCSAFKGTRQCTRALNFVEWLGVDTSSHNEFDSFEDGPERQAVRFAWLHFAADLWDEGLDDERNR